MRTCYFVTYDISDDRRWRQVYRILRGAGDHVQYSVFRCELSDRERVQLMADLDAVIDHVSDQVLFIDVGPPDGRAADCVSALGRAFTVPSRRAIIV